MSRWKPDFGIKERRNAFMQEALTVTTAGTSIPYVFLSSKTHAYNGSGAVFLIKGEKLFMRFEWGCWYVLSPSCDSDVIEISRQGHVMLHVYHNGKRSDNLLRVYEAEELPHKLFFDSDLMLLPDGTPSEMHTTSDPAREDASSAEDMAEMAEIDFDMIPEELRSDPFKAPNTLKDLQPLLDTHMSPLKPLFRRIVNGRICSFAVYATKTDAYVFSCCHLRGEWFANDKCKQENEPLWFSNEIKAVSPFRVTDEFTETVKKSSGIRLKAAIFFDPGMEIMNEEDFIAGRGDIEVISFLYDGYPVSMNSEDYFSELAKKDRGEPRIDTLDLEKAIAAYETLNKPE